MRRPTAMALVGLMIMLTVTVSASAAPSRSPDIPDALVPWEKWVLHDDPERLCPGHFDDDTRRRCWWPTHLIVNASDQGALFDLQVTVYASTWVTLPGGDDHWPESVVGGNDALPVTEHASRPAVWLTTGEHRISGAFVWKRLPEMLQVPAATGVLSLTIDGRDVAAPDVDMDGRVRLRGSGEAARLEDRMSVAVFRLIEDDIPMRITTRLLLQVAGQPREVRLTGLLHPSATVMHIDSPLAARLGKDGDLLLQVRPGRWDISVTVRLTEPVDRLTMGSGQHGAEIWSFQAFNHLRMVRLSGAPAIEPSRTEMPDAWKAFPAYRLESGDTLQFEVIRRGDPDPAADRLNLVRTWWLDFDGSGFTLHDRINGTLSRTWHLAMEPPVELGRVSVDGREQLITLQGDGPSPGVQLRRGELVMEADSRLARTSSSLPAVGWDHDFQHVRGILNLPPGWALFAAAGVDIPPETWLERWSLLDLFLVLIIAVSTLKLRNRNAGLLALATLLLIYHEPGAPRVVWLHLLAAAALLRHLPDSWFKTVVKLWGLAAVIALIAIAIPFAAQQMRNAIYPQLAPHAQAVPDLPTLQHRAAELEERIAASPRVRSAVAPTLDKAKTAQAPTDPSLDQQPRWATDPDALIQTGPGLPVWQWRAVQLRWNGPVDRSHRLRLWLIPPAMNRLLGLVRTALLFGLIVVFMDLRNWRRYLPASLKTGAALSALLVCLAAPALPVRAQPGDPGFPPPAMLEELRRRLLEPPPCLPHCADVSRLELAATPDQLRLIMQVHGSVDTAVPLPATLDTWQPNRILLDNQPVASLARDARGALWMMLPRGVHQVKLIGPTGDADEIRLAFPLRPRTGTYAGVGWQAQGFGPGGSVDTAIALTRVTDDRGSPADTPTAAIPPFFEVTRTLQLGIQWTVATRIRRLTAPGTPAVLSVPLLLQASITTPGIQVQDGVARVPFGPEDTETAFHASLPIASRLTLTAPPDVPWREVWILDAATLWRCRPAGLTVVQHQDDERYWQPQWRPWPGEQVTIDVSRPKTVAGRTVTVDRAHLALAPGRRFTQATLTLALRSGKGGQHQLELPASANLQSVAMNGGQLPIRQDGQLITLPLEPGAQTATIRWLQLTGRMARIRAPQVNVGEAAVNASITMQMPDNRWILLAGGPRLGPAVLFWSYLTVVLLAAAALGRTTLTPLNTRQWLLLALGLTQVPAAVAIVVVGWLLALGTRRRWTVRRAWAFNGVQLLLAVLTLAALAGLYLAIERGLLGIPDMQIAGNGSTRNQLNWMQDRIAGPMPGAWVVSLPQWCYHILMLAWSLWLAVSLVGWLRWGWSCFALDGLWKPVRWRWKPGRRAAKQAGASSSSTATGDGISAQGDRTTSP